MAGEIIRLVRIVVATTTNFGALMKTRRKAGIKQERRELAMYRQKRLILAACKLWELRRFGKVIQ